MSVLHALKRWCMANKFNKTIISFIESNVVQRFIIGLIVVNSIIIGFETSPEAIVSYGSLLQLMDRLILAVFVIEMLIKIYAYRLSYFMNGWNVFDFIIVSVALLPTYGSLSILRAFRIFRALRLIKNVPKLRFIVEALFHSLPSLSWIFVLLSLVFYVFAVVGTKAFGTDFPMWFGTLGGSMFTLFQIMTLEGWAEISRTVQQTYPFAVLYFISFILIASYTTLNIFIAIVVNTMSEIQHQGNAEHIQVIESIIKDERSEFISDLNVLKDVIVRLEKKIERSSP